VQQIFDALAEPNRRSILGLLAARELSVGELEARLELPQPLVSKHLRVLRETGFVEARVEAQSRVYRLRPEPLVALDKWLEPYRRFWTRHLDALERHLERMPDPVAATATRRQPAARAKRRTTSKKGSRR
jgi:DNA-binding transcriptional ArsR family regulator